MTDDVTFIGDVHGWSSRLDEIADQLPGEKIFVGDLIDRGPDSAGVVRRVRQWCEAGQARCIMGNHEYALVRGLGVPELGIEPCPPLLEMWYVGYGGEQTFDSYGIADLFDLGAAMGEDLVWMASLPWVLEGDGWVVSHAGFDAVRPLAQQVAQLGDPLGQGWYRRDANLPDDLYAKDRIGVRPPDCPPDLWLVCGHVPQREAMIADHCIACDTSGGKPGRQLSGVVFPSLSVVTSTVA